MLPENEILRLYRRRRWKMAIPEHEKCVKTHKWIRQFRQKGNWKRIRAFRRKACILKPKARIRQLIKAEQQLIAADTLKRYGFKSWTEHQLHIYKNKHYRKYGKYDD